MSARRTRVKICCIASVAEAAMAVASGADAVGLVGAMPSGPGPIPEDLIAEIAGTVQPPVASVLLTAAETATEIVAQVMAAGVTCVQIVRHIDPAEAAALADLLPSLRRIQVIHVESEAALTLIPLYAPHADAFLLDSGKPSAAQVTLGGTGLVHNWAISEAFVEASPLPVFLAGGLNPGNVGDAIRRVRPFGVDVCSGLRTDGHLDAVKLQAFMTAVTAADQIRT
ncbi:phosphoribosylanthranilate isomerase [Acidisoma cladoniae]|uniref:phosphoribosylanthranilate isomerase n=1 Tax=Acidisoma cladoniae TaxID=3040935 RepID=UPI00254E4272|nr:phosphoribosylanthranilate isomerase [Acidisoma sp. PAMC 29798]